MASWLHCVTFVLTAQKYKDKRFFFSEVCCQVQLTTRIPASVYSFALSFGEFRRDCIPSEVGPAILVSWSERAHVHTEQRILMQLASPKPMCLFVSLSLFFFPPFCLGSKSQRELIKQMLWLKNIPAAVCSWRACNELIQFCHWAGIK